MADVLRGVAKRAFLGGVAGAIATVPMSALLAASGALGLMGRQPPRVIVETALPSIDRRPARVLAMVAHFGFGAGSGSLYALGTRPGEIRILRGIGFGLLVWAASYEGWIPAFHILPPAHGDERGRAITMPLAHTVFGTALALAHGFRRR